jgi:hypothetical protein
MEIQGLKSLMSKLSLREKAAASQNPKVIVGYTASYAVRVHEDLEVHHRNGQAKFLEQPVRQMSNDGTLKGIVDRAVLEGKTMGQALLLAGLRIQRESQLLCPVLTGNLRNSAFTRLEP